MKKIYKELTKLATNIQESKSTNSIYFNLNSIKIRISDHISVVKNCHLNLIILKNNYLLIPTFGTYKKYLSFTNVNEIINFIKNYDLTYTILIGTPSKNKNHIKDQTEAIVNIHKNNSEIEENDNVIQPIITEPEILQTKSIAIEAQNSKKYEEIYKSKIKEFTCNYHPELLEITQNYLNLSTSINNLHKRLDFLNSMQNLNKGQRVSMIKNLMQL